MYVCSDLLSWFISDNSLGWSVIYLTWTLTSVTASVCGVIYATPLFIFAIIPIFLVYGYIQVSQQ